MPWLVAGLGNPGDRYARTRHNAGRMVVQAMADEAGTRFRKVRFLPAEVAEIDVGGERILLVVSTLYMNESGTSYAGVARKQRISPANLIAVHDDIDIAPGELRVKFGGGTAGHNGLRSLQQALRTPDFHRVRIGVGRPPGRQDPADFVLDPMTKGQLEELSAALSRAAEAVRSLIQDGLALTQERYNRAAGKD